MSKPTVVIVTGHPAAGKTTLAHQIAKETGLLLIWKDQIKESLYETLGADSLAESRQLGRATWELLYLQIENLLQANISFIVEGNFEPQYATPRWGKLVSQYEFKILQLRCTAAPTILLQRYKDRMTSGERHPAHVFEADNSAFIELIQAPMAWIDVPGERLSIDTTDPGTIQIKHVIQKLG